MKHLGRIRSYIQTLVRSDRIHTLVLLSPPGFAKSTTIDQALKGLGIDHVQGGSYATPLHIYNLLCRHPNATIVLDDCSGIFEDTKAMSVLKSAAWSATGARRVSWGSTSDKVVHPSVVFNGKLILIANSIPRSREAQAFLSRSIFYEMHFGKTEVVDMLRKAANSPDFFGDTALAQSVADFLVDQIKTRDHSSISLRTLHVGCELASTHPEEWMELLEPLLPAPDPENLLESLIDSPLSAKEQEGRFIAETGLSRRTYYNEKKRLGLSRPYRRAQKKPKKRK